MAEKTTFIKLDRNILSWRWYQNANTMRVFLHLLLTANIKPLGFEKLTIQRGEKVTTYEKIANELAMTTQQVRTAISHLKLTGELTIKKYPKYQVIAIEKYDLYQGYQQSNQQASNRQLTGNQQATNRQLTPIKEYKNKIIKECKKRELGDFVPPTPSDVKQYCSERGNNIDGQRFVDYYAARGWKVGKGVMKDWRAAVRSWERLDKNNTLDIEIQALLQKAAKEGYGSVKK